MYFTGIYKGPGVIIVNWMAKKDRLSFDLSLNIIIWRFMVIVTLVTSFHLNSLQYSEYTPTEAIRHSDPYIYLSCRTLCTYMHL